MSLSSSRSLGSIDGRPFVPQAAYLVDQIRWNNGETTTEIMIFERPIACEDVKPFGLMPGERAVRVDVQAPWPVFPGSVWNAVVFDSPPAGRRREATIAFVRRSPTGSETGTLADGSVRVVEATDGGGVVHLSASRAGPATMPGTVNGTVAFTKCLRSRR